MWGVLLGVLDCGCGWEVSRRVLCGCRWWCSIADLGGRCCAGRWLGVFLVACELGCYAADAA